MDDIEKKDLIARYIDAYNAFDIDGMLQLLSPDVGFENYDGSDLTASADGIAEFRVLAEKAGELFAEREQKIISLDIGDERALAAIAYRGKLAADIPSGLAAGTILKLEGTTEFAFRDGKISRIVDRS